MPEPPAPVPPVNEPPPPCDQDVFKNGHGICCVDARMHQMEAWVKKVAERSGQRVDVRYEFTGGEGGWPGDVPRFMLDVSAMNRLGWKARHTSEQAVRMAIAASLERMQPVCKP